ncbi:BREX-4 system phosphatase PglZ [Methanocaldococcus sp.]
MEINSFKDIQEILDEIIIDKKSPNYIRNRFPIRFIFFPNKETFREFIKKVIVIKDRDIRIKFETINIKDFCEYSTPNSIIKFIKSKIEYDKDLLIVPISEIIRFYDNDKFSSVFQQLSEIEFKENKNKIRIYIPIIGLYGRFEKEFLDRFSREEWAPIWRLDIVPDKKVIVYCLNIELDSKKIDKLENKYIIIKTFEDWINLWKNEETMDIISLCDEVNYLSKYSSPDSFYTFENIETYDKLLEKILKINIPILYNDKEKHFWRKLTENIIKLKIQNFNELIEKIFKKTEIFYEDIIELWIRGNAFQRWLLKWYVLINEKWKDTYLYRVLKDINEYNNLSSLEQSLWFKIFEIEKLKGKELFNDRYKLIKVFYEKSGKSPTKDIEIILKEKFSKLSNLGLKQKIRYLTDITQFEKEQIILCMVQALKSGELTKKDILELLKEIYLKLYYYLDNVTFTNLDEENKWIIEYFNEYRWSKVLNEPSDKLLNLLNEKNRDKYTFARWYWKFKLHKDILNNNILVQIEKNESTKIVWIDGLGIEFVPLIKNIVNGYENYFIENIFVGRVELPSITKFNEFKCDEKINDLDEYIHKQNPYKHPKCIVEEIEIINNIFKKILGDYDKIIIVSDHGFTPFAKKEYGNFKKYDNFDPKHEGRYVCLETLDKNIRDNLEDNTDFMRDPNDRALVALKYTSLGNVPKREVHGGATPEEVLVPIIVISKDKDKILYEIHLKKTDLYINNPKLSLEIIPDPKYKPYITFEGQKLELNYDDSKKEWFIKLPIKKPGKYKLKLSIGNYHKDIEVEIKSGLKERDIL